MNRCTQPEKRRSLRLPWLIPLLGASIAAVLPSAAGQAAHTKPLGLLWSVQGEWHHENGELLAAGDAVAPGELLQPSLTSAGHQAIALLPDGQRLFYQCAGVKDCSRGFRVPQFNATPSAFAIELLNRVRLEEHSARLPPDSPPASRTVPPASDEMVATLTPEKQIRLTGLAATLAPGSYTYDLVRVSGVSAPSDAPSQRGHPLQKAVGPALLPLPGPGLYEVRIVDVDQTQRIHLLVLATSTKDAAAAAKFAQAGQTLREWNEKSGGWPMHPLLRLYLLSLTAAPTGQG